MFEALRRLTNDERYPPVRRLVHGVELCRLLEQARIDQFDNAKLSELVQVLEEHVVVEAAPHFTERVEPKRVARTLFRQLASMLSVCILPVEFSPPGGHACE